MIIFTFLGTSNIQREGVREKEEVGLSRLSFRYLKSAYVACIVLTMLEELLF